MKIQSTRRLPEAQRQPGLLIGIERPPAGLAREAQRIHGLAAPPRSVLLGVPAGATGSDPLDKAILDTSVAVTKLLTTELAKASGVKPVEYGVKVVWHGVKAWKLLEKWQRRDRDVAALLVETTAAGLGVLRTTYAGAGETELVDWQSDFLDNSALQSNLDSCFMVARAATGDYEFGSALLNAQIGTTELGRALGLVTPVLNAALSDDPAFAEIRFGPLPMVKRTPREPRRSNAARMLENLPRPGGTD